MVEVLRNRGGRCEGGGTVWQGVVIWFDDGPIKDVCPPPSSPLGTSRGLHARTISNSPTRIPPPGPCPFCPIDSFLFLPGSFSPGQSWIYIWRCNTGVAPLLFGLQMHEGVGCILRNHRPTGEHAKHDVSKAVHLVPSAKDLLDRNLGKIKKSSSLGRRSFDDRSPKYASTYHHPSLLKQGEREEGGWLCDSANHSADLTSHPRTIPRPIQETSMIVTFHNGALSPMSNHNSALDHTYLS
ncbi:hypothetical protein QBC42DRAFT_261637 [Cladorrhinum samala]|uniref:Uncharacterized protein n=1 Tax=Cladorrhinum samala TaxID=585594 RepID=A0AAV9I029_9PEZI|nr:hypothetical protein QBC42DRAFT_261637 [Cladorrhinum samala]